MKELFIWPVPFSIVYIKNLVHLFKRSQSRFQDIGIVLFVQQGTILLLVVRHKQQHDTTRLRRRRRTREEEEKKQEARSKRSTPLLPHHHHHSHSHSHNPRQGMQNFKQACSSSTVTQPTIISVLSNQIMKDSKLHEAKTYIRNLEFGSGHKKDPKKKEKQPQRSRTSTFA